MITFGKKTGCPSSEQVLGYIKKSLTLATARRVASHLASCDFCGAEILFMTRYAPTEGHTSSSTSSQVDVAQTVLISQTVYQNHERQAA
jgi:hypothetical protein